MRKIAITLSALALLGSAPAAFAATGIAFTGVGGYLDYVDPEHIDAVLGFGGLVDLGMVTPEIGLEGNVDYWSKSMDFLNWSTSSRLVSIGATGKYYIPAGESPLRPFGGIGLALHLVHGSVDYNAGYVPYPGFIGEASSDDTKIGIDLCGGTRYGLNEELDLLGELRYRLVSDVNQIVLRAGVVYRLAE